MDEPTPAPDERPAVSPDESAAAVGSEPAAPLEDEPLQLPPWVAPAIGIVLVAIAAMAVWTGFRPRMATETKYVITGPRIPAEASPMTEDSGGAPGDPGPGASSVVQSETGGAVPAAGPLPVGELPRPAIEGDAEGVVPTASYEVRRGIAFDCDRPDAIVYVNDLPMGEAAQYASKDQPYEFPQEGTFNVRVRAKDGTEARFTIVAAAGAETDVELIRVRIVKR